MRRRCYDCNQAQARYEAHLNYDQTPIVLLCDDCARWERDWDSVVWIRSIRETEGEPCVLAT